MEAPRFQSDKCFWFCELRKSSYKISLSTPANTSGLMEKDDSLVASGILDPTVELLE